MINQMSESINSELNKQKSNIVNGSKKIDTQNYLINKSIEQMQDDKKWLEYAESRVNDSSLSEKERSYYNRILRVYNMEDLSKLEGHPINMVIDKIVNAEFFNGFDHVDVPQVVGEWETFDLFNFPEDHVARRPSDSYFLYKSNDTKNSMLLRPHTSVMWYHYLLNQGGKEKLEKQGDVVTTNRAI